MIATFQDAVLVMEGKALRGVVDLIVLKKNMINQLGGVTLKEGEEAKMGAKKKTRR